MTEIEQIKTFIANADASTISTLESTISNARQMRTAERNAALPDFPFVVSRYGHAAPIQVTREKAIKLLMVAVTGWQRRKTWAEMLVSEWISTVGEDELAHLEEIVNQERRKRNRLAAAPPSDAVEREVDRLLAVRDAWRKEAADAWDAHVKGVIERRLKQFESGRLGMCSCRDCLSGYVARDMPRMCEKGQRQCREDINNRQQYVP